MRIVLEKDTMTPDLQARIDRWGHPRPALRKMGELMANWAKDAFRNPAKRPTEWPPLKPSTLKKKKGRGTPLVYHGVLKRSPRVVSCDDRSVVVGSDRKAGSYSLAAIHQLGAPRAKIPARPFFPFHPGVRALAAFEEKCRKILKDYLEKGSAR